MFRSAEIGDTFPVFDGNGRDLHVLALAASLTDRTEIIPLVRAIVEDSGCHAVRYSEPVTFSDD
jgi:hypothetical protein